MISEAAPDDSDMRTQAVLSLMQTQLFDTLIALQEAGSEGVDPAKRLALISQCGKGNCFGSSIYWTKKWMLMYVIEFKRWLSLLKRLLKRRLVP